MKPTTNIEVITFPLDHFGQSGCRAGAELLQDAIEEFLLDNEEEPRPFRPDAYQGLVNVTELSFPTAKDLLDWKSQGRKIFRQLRKKKSKLLWLGGNHLSVLPVYEELASKEVKKPGTNLVIQFDAHWDLYQLHDVTAHPANGNFLLHSDEPTPPIIQIGHRDLLLHPSEAKPYFEQIYSALDIQQHGMRIFKDILTRCQHAKSIWIDIDIDVIDPAFAPAVQQPLPFGLAPLQFLQILQTLWNTGKVNGVSLSEFDPSRDQRDQTLELLGWLIEWMLLAWTEPTASPQT